MPLLFWLMLLPLMVEGMPFRFMWMMLFSTWFLADVIANSVMWLMLLPLILFFENLEHSLTLQLIPNRMRNLHSHKYKCLA